MNKQFLTDVHDRLIKGNEEYGDSFGDIAALWSMIFGTTVTPRKVALAMIALKVVRLSKGTNHADSVLDIAGYATLMDQMDE